MYVDYLVFIEIRIPLIEGTFKNIYDIIMLLKTFIAYRDIIYSFGDFLFFPVIHFLLDVEFQVKVLEKKAELLQT